MIDNVDSTIDIGQLCGCIDGLTNNNVQFYSMKFAGFVRHFIRCLFVGDDTAIPAQPISFNHHSIQLGRHRFSEHDDLVVNEITIYTDGTVFVTIDAEIVTANKLRAISDFMSGLECFDNGLGCEVTLDHETDECGLKTFEIRARYEMG